MYRKLLVPVKEAYEVEPTIRLASLLVDPDGEIRVLHVIPTTTLPEVTRQWRNSVSIVVPAHETGAALDLRVEPEVRASPDVPGEILESAESHGVDGILLTLGGDRRSRNPFVGHTASALLHHARSDVLIANRLALTGARIGRLLLPTFGEQPNPRALRLAETLALRSPGARLLVLALCDRTHADTPPDADGTTERGVAFTTKHVPVAPTLLHRAHRRAEPIVQAAARERYGFVLLSEEPQLAAGPVITRRFLEDVFRAAPCPVLALRS